MSIDRPVIEIIIISHDLRHELPPEDDLIAMLQHVFHEQEFGLRRLDDFLIPPELEILEIELDIIECQLLIALLDGTYGTDTLQDRPDPCEQLSGRERLSDIIVGSELKRTHLIAFPSSR